jgi:hypothetical protein
MVMNRRKRPQPLKIGFGTELSVPERGFASVSLQSVPRSSVPRSSQFSVLEQRYHRVATARSKKFDAPMSASGATSITKSIHIDGMPAIFWQSN